MIDNIIEKTQHIDGYIIVTHRNEFDTDIVMKTAVNANGEYIGDVDFAKTLYLKYGIKPELASKTDTVCSIGFSEKHQKWYGWSHRAIYGFGIGSEVKKGDCAYVANTPDGLIDSHVEFFADFNNAEKQALCRAECQVLQDGSGIRILHAPLIITMTTNINDVWAWMDGEDVSTEEYDIFCENNAVEIVKCGKGEWTAITLDDARQMAIDFAQGVS